MEHTELYNAIAEFLISLGFLEPTKDVPSFRCKALLPGKTVIINGQKMEDHPKEVFFDITPIGQGEILSDKKELQGYTFGYTDIWVESLDDFKFWFEKATRNASSLSAHIKQD